MLPAINTVFSDLGSVEDMLPAINTVFSDYVLGQVHARLTNDDFSARLRISKSPNTHPNSDNNTSVIMS
jgi:hypothetical protein